MKDNNCIFCLLANGDIPTNSIYEDEYFNVILDNAPSNDGHALIVTKDHYQNLFELPEDVAAKVLPLAKKIAAAMTEALGCDGVNLVNNNGAAANQTVPHFHLHVIPRYEGRNEGMLLWEQHPENPDLQKEIVAKMRKALEK